MACGGSRGSPLCRLGDRGAVKLGREALDPVPPRTSRGNRRIRPESIQASTPVNRPSRAATWRCACCPAPLTASAATGPGRKDTTRNNRSRSSAKLPAMSHSHGGRRKRAIGISSLLKNGQPGTPAIPPCGANQKRPEVIGKGAEATMRGGPLAGQRVNHRDGARKQQRLENACVKRWKMRPHSTDTIARNSSPAATRRYARTRCVGLHERERPPTPLSGTSPRRSAEHMERDEHALRPKIPPRVTSSPLVERRHRRRPSSRRAASVKDRALPCRTMNRMKKRNQRDGAECASGASGPSAAAMY